MADLTQLFELAQQEVVELSEAPEMQDKLKLYALFKQANLGDVEGERPSAVNFVAQAKYDAWAKVKGLSKTDAMQQYIDIVTRLKELEQKS